MLRPIAFALGLALAAPAAAFAQSAATPDPALAYEAARNQLGILKYCAQAGHTGTEAVAAQEKMVGMLPAGDAAENQGTTIDAQCKEIEAAVNQVAAGLPG